MNFETLYRNAFGNLGVSAAIQISITVSTFKYDFDRHSIANRVDELRASAVNRITYVLFKFVFVL